MLYTNGFHYSYKQSGYFLLFVIHVTTNVGTTVCILYILYVCMFKTCEEHRI